MVGIRQPNGSETKSHVVSITILSMEKSGGERPIVAILWLGRWNTSNVDIAASFVSVVFATIATISAWFTSSTWRKESTGFIASEFIAIELVVNSGGLDPIPLFKVVGKIAITISFSSVVETFAGNPMVIIAHKAIMRIQNHGGARALLSRIDTS